VTRSRRLTVALALNVVLVGAQVVFGLAAHSLGLLSDAGHNLTDVAAVVTSLVAVRWARRAPTRSRSYGFHRGTILAALVNAASLLAVTAFIVAEGVSRLRHPRPVEGGIVVVVAIVAFLVNAGSALVLERGSADLNMRSALLHMVGDAAASLGVAAAGLVIFLRDGAYWLDPLVSIALGLFIAWKALALLGQAADVLLESTPKDLDLDHLTRVVTDVDGVEAVHDLHVWSLSSEVRALSAHLVLAGHPTLEEAQAVSDQVKRAVARPFSVAHATFELECEPCVPGDPGCTMDAAGLSPSSHGHRHSDGHGH
jgi:cobalt-zinc-cadmium efflux system protein